MTKVPGAASLTPQVPGTYTQGDSRTKIQLSTLLTLIGFIVFVVTVLGLMRFYPDLRRYVQMKSM